MMEGETLLSTMFLGMLYVVVTVVPSLVVLLLPLLSLWPGGNSPVGMTFTGSDTETMERGPPLCARVLRLLNVVGVVMPSLVVVLPSFENSRLGGTSSDGIMYTGSDAAMMEERERPAFASGLAKEELTKRKAKTMALESRGR